MSETEEKKGFWAIVSLLGHQTLAGYLDEYTMAGCGFLRITIPETSTQPEWSRLFTEKSVYSIDPVNEEVARHRANQMNVAPMAIWDTKALLQKELEKQGKVLVSQADLPEGFLKDKTPEVLLAHPAPVVPREEDDEDRYPF